MSNCCEYKLEQEIVDFIAECRTKENPESYLIAILHKVQGMHGYLSNEAMDEVAHLLGVPAADVCGVATFYHYFRLKPQGKYHISICLGTACFVKGAETIITNFKNELGIDMGETTADGNFSLVATRCIGVCALAPVVTINEQVYSNVVPSQVSEILVKLRKELKTV